MPSVKPANYLNFEYLFYPRYNKEIIVWIFPYGRNYFSMIKK